MSAPRRPPRARPVADAPVAALAGDAEGLAREWIAELVLAAPLAAAPSLPVGELAARGPGLVRAVAEALADDGALARLEPGGAARELAAAARVGDAAATLAAVEALRRVLWSAALAAAPRA